jgi:hypothetical protein
MEKSDVLYEGSDVLYDGPNICILKPESRRGALCFTRVCADAISCETGINKSNYPTEFRRENIFFRAATKLNPGIMDAENAYWVDELYCYFESYNLNVSRDYGIAVIRVDPEKTNVFYSEYRSIGDRSARPSCTYADFLYNSDDCSVLNGSLKHTNAEIVFPCGEMSSSWFVYGRVSSKSDRQGVCAAVLTRHVQKNPCYQ